MNSTTMELLTQDEVGRLVMARANATPDGFTEEDARAVVDWAEGVRIDVAMLDGVLAGDFTARLNPESGEMEFGLTPQGQARVEAMGKEASHVG